MFIFDLFTDIHRTILPFQVKGVRVDMPRLFQIKGVRLDMPRLFQVKGVRVDMPPSRPLQARLGVKEVGP
jgi:hypothetical protein